MDTLVTFAPCLGVFLAGYFAADVVRFVRRAFERARGARPGPGKNAAAPAAPVAYPERMTLVGIRQVEGNVYELETVSAQYGRVVREVLILPSSSLEWPGR